MKPSEPSNPGVAGGSRRDFLRRGTGGAVAGMVAAILGERPLLGADGGRNPFAYDVERYERTDPALVGYELVRRFRSPVREPRRLAMGPGDRLYLAAEALVVVLDETGVPRSEIACGDVVRSLAVGADGVVYAGMRDHVEIFDAKGKRLATWSAPEGRPYLTGLAVGESDLFVADSGNRVVWRYDLEGNLVGRIGAKDRERGVPGLILPSPFLDVELGHDGLLRVNNPGRHRVELYTIDGGLELYWGRFSMAMPGFCGCCNPVNLALLPDGRVVTFEKGIPRVKVYSATGDFECVVAGAENFASTAAEEAIMDADERAYGGLDGVVDSRGRIFILDLLAAEVQLLQAKADSPGAAASGGAR